MTKQMRVKQMKLRAVSSVILIAMSLLVGGIILSHPTKPVKKLSKVSQVRNGEAQLTAGLSTKMLNMLEPVWLRAGVGDLDFEKMEISKSKEPYEKKPVKKKSTKKEKVSKGFPQFEDDWLMLALITYYEVGNCPRQDKVLTASVVINRCRTKYRLFRNVDTFSEVLYQHDCGQQYADRTINLVERYYKGSYNYRKKVLKDLEKSQCSKIAKGLISGDIDCAPEYVLDQSEFSASTLASWGIRVLDLGDTHETYGTPMDYHK